MSYLTQRQKDSLDQWLTTEPDGPPCDPADIDKCTCGDLVRLDNGTASVCQQCGGWCCKACYAEVRGRYVVHNGCHAAAEKFECEVDAEDAAIELEESGEAWDVEKRWFGV